MHAFFSYLVAELARPVTVLQAVVAWLCAVWWRNETRRSKARRAAKTVRKESELPVYYTVSVDGSESRAHYGTDREAAELAHVRALLRCRLGQLRHRITGAPAPPRVRYCKSLLGYVPAEMLALMARLPVEALADVEESGPWGVFDGKLMRVFISSRKWERRPPKTCQASKDLAVCAEPQPDPPEEHF